MMPQPPDGPAELQAAAQLPATSEPSPEQLALRATSSEPRGVPPLLGPHPGCAPAAPAHDGSITVLIEGAAKGCDGQVAGALRISH
jgi:hypothetical protein